MAQLALQPGRDVWSDLKRVTVHEGGAEDAVDVLGDACPAVGERLIGERPRQDGAENEPADRDDPGACDQEDSKQRERTLSCRPKTRTVGCQQLHDLSSLGIGSAAESLEPGGT